MKYTTTTFENTDSLFHNDGQYQETMTFLQNLKDNKQVLMKFDSSSSLSDSSHSDELNKDDRLHNKHQQAIERRHKNFQVKKKTELCKTYLLGLSCPYGNKCSFAHGTEELRNKQLVPTNYKTVKCKQFFERECCNFGPRCQFQHKCQAPVTPMLPALDHGQMFEALVNSLDKKTPSNFGFYNSYGFANNTGSFGRRRLRVFEEKNINYF